MESRQLTIREIRLGSDGTRQATIEKSNLKPSIPGQYFQVVNPTDSGSDLAVTLYLVGDPPGPGTIRVAPIPLNWKVGDQLMARGPLGNGFRLNRSGISVGILVLTDSMEELLPVIHQLLENQDRVTVYSSADVSRLPLAVEAYPLESWQEQLASMDELILETRLDNIGNLRDLLGVGHDFKFPLPVQLMVYAPMPCAGVGECGVCALPTKNNKYRLVCTDGPVFDIKEIDW